MRIVVTGGGSGGHIFPALAVAEGLRRLLPGVELLYIGGSTGMECQIVPRSGVPFQAVTARKLQKLVSPSTFGVAWSLYQGYREAKTYLRAFRAEAVIGTGGYVAAAATLAGAHLGLPTIVVAPDMIAGRTNRMLARKARRVCIAFAAAAAQYPGSKTVLTGLPLRSSIVAPSQVTSAQARCAFDGLDAAKFTLLVIGGSQGAQAVNNLVLDAIPALGNAGVQVLHQTGVRNFEAVHADAERRGLLSGGGYLPAAFFDETQVPLAYRAADVILCRGGMSTLSELTVNGLPALIVPLPTAYADHQTANARALESLGGATHLPEISLSAERICTEVLALKDDPSRCQRMAEASYAAGRPDAADAVAREVIALVSICRS